MITDTDRLNWLIENEAYGFIDSDNYQNFYEATINDAVRAAIDKEIKSSQPTNAADAEGRCGFCSGMAKMGLQYCSTCGRKLRTD